MGGEQTVTDFDEALALIRGLAGRLVEASIFLPKDDREFPVTSFAGVLDGIEDRPEDRWRLLWREGGGIPLPSLPSVTIWRGRFNEAALSFTGDVEDSFEEVDPTHGQNTFLKLYCEGFILALCSYD